MMQNVHLAPENNEDDLYSGYNDYNPMFDTEVKYLLFPTFPIRRILTYNYKIRIYEYNNIQVYNCFEVKFTLFSKKHLKFLKIFLNS